MLLCGHNDHVVVGVELQLPLGVERLNAVDCSPPVLGANGVENRQLGLGNFLPTVTYGVGGVGTRTRQVLVEEKHAPLYRVGIGDGTCRLALFARQGCGHGNSCL